MIIFIPLAQGQSIIKPLEFIVPCVTEGLFESSKNKDLKSSCLKVQCELNSRNLAIEYYNKYYYNEKYVAMQDRDIIHIYSDNYSKCVEYLDNNPECDAVALPWKDYTVTDHIRNAAFVIRGSVFKHFKFRIDTRYHICATMKEDLKNYIFLPSTRKLIYEIR